jgi:hypothetical protein
MNHMGKLFACYSLLCVLGFLQCIRVFFDYISIVHEEALGY